MEQPPREDALSVWRRRRAAAVREAFESMPAPARRAVQAAKLSPEARAEKQKRRLEKRQTAVRMIFSGATVAEIAQALGTSPRAAQVYLSRQSLPHNSRSGFRRRWLWLCVEDDSRMAALAGELGCDVNEALRRLVAACLEDDGHVARRQLGMRKRPT